MQEGEKNGGTGVPISFCIIDFGENRKRMGDFHHQVEMHVSACADQKRILMFFSVITNG